MGPVDQIDIYINSMGGDVWQGNAMYNVLKDHKARKTVKIVGMAASIASIIAMAGDEILIAKNGFMFIHDAQVTAYRLNAAKLRRTADELDLVSDQMAETYARRGKVDAMEMRKIMRKEALLNADKVVEMGLADGFMEAVPAENLKAHYDILKAEYKDAFSDVRAAIEAAAEESRQNGDQPEGVVETPAADAPAQQDPQKRDDSEVVPMSAVEIADLKARREAMFYAGERRLKELDARLQNEKA